MPEQLHATSLGKGLLLLDVLGGSERALGLSELSRRSHLPKSTAHRLLATLLATRMVEREDDRYVLGPGLLPLARRAAARTGLPAVARPALETLADLSGERAHLGTAVDREVLYVDTAEGEAVSGAGARPGDRHPLHSTALGKCLVAYGEPDLCARLLAGPLVVRTPRTLVEPGRLRTELERVRARGWALDDGESAAGRRCVAAPVIGPAGVAVAAISVSGPAARIADRRVRPLAQQVVRHAEQVGRRLVAASVEGAAPPLDGDRAGRAHLREIRGPGPAAARVHP